MSNFITMKIKLCKRISYYKHDSLKMSGITFKKIVKISNKKCNGLLKKILKF